MCAISSNGIPTASPRPWILRSSSSSPAMHAGRPMMRVCSPIVGMSGACFVSSSRLSSASPSIGSTASMICRRGTSPPHYPTPNARRRSAGRSAHHSRCDWPHHRVGSHPGGYLGGGQIMVGTVAPIKGAAIAHDGKQTLAMLRRRPPRTDSRSAGSPRRRNCRRQIHRITRRRDQYRGLRHALRNLTSVRRQCGLGMTLTLKQRSRLALDDLYSRFRSLRQSTLDYAGVCLH